MNLMQLPDELNSKRQDPEDEYKTKMYQSKKEDSKLVREYVQGSNERIIVFNIKSLFPRFKIKDKKFKKSRTFYERKEKKL